MTDSHDGTSPGGKQAMIAQGPTAGPSFPFDQVVVLEGGSRRNMSPGEFFALPLAQRIQFVVTQKAAFYAAGHEVDPKEVLGQMRKMRALLH